jgi:hypothetical protein
MRKKDVCKLVAASVLVCTASVSQAALVEFWSYTVDMHWKDPVFSASTNPNFSSKSTSTMLSWGYKGGVDGVVYSVNSAPYNRSSLEIINPRGSGTVASNSGVRQVNMFRHTNNEILASYGALTEATMSVSVNLTPLGTTVPVETLTKDFKIYFYETPNISGSGCAWGNCADDLFAFALMPQIYDVFVYDGYEYTFNYFQTSGPNAIKQFSANVCSEISGGVLTTSCYGFQTRESAQTTIQFGFSITAVPEPETYAMLLAGLGVVGVVARRRRNAIRS